MSAFAAPLLGVRDRTLLPPPAESWCLYAPPLLVAGVAALAPLAGPALSTGVVALAAIPSLAHILSTGTVYLDARNRCLFRGSPRVFYFAPLLILALAGLLRWISPPWLPGALLLVAVHHNTRQSTGILNLTRRLHGGQGFRRVEEVLVWAGNGACLAWTPLLSWPDGARAVLEPLTGVVFLIVLAFYLRDARASPPQGLHRIFLLVSLSLSWPLVAVGDPLLAWALMSLPHQAQYLGVFWTCQRNRYDDPRLREEAAPLLKTLTRDWVLCALVLCTLAAALRALETGTGGPIQDVFTAVVLAMTLGHYWLDAFLWRGRDPALRGLLLDHLRPAGWPRP